MFHINVSSWWFLCWLFVSLGFFLQAKLIEGVSLAKEFHSNVQELLFKMSKCEESVGQLPAPSFVLDTVCSQLQDHRVGLFLTYCHLSICLPHIFLVHETTLNLCRNCWVRWMITARWRAPWRTQLVDSRSSAGRKTVMSFTTWSWLSRTVTKSCSSVLQKEAGCWRRSRRMPNR